MRLYNQTRHRMPVPTLVLCTLKSGKMSLKFGFGKTTDEIFSSTVQIEFKAK